MASKLLMGTLGAAGMYYLDPRLGRRRRVVLRDKLIRLSRRAGHGADLGVRDLAHRAQGLAASGRRVARPADADDRVIEARVRSLLGRIVAHPRQVHVTSSGGIVLLSGVVAPHEHDQLLGAVRMTRGVHGLNNDLDVDHSQARDRDGAALATTHGHTFELMQHNWSPAARLLAAAGGGWAAACGFARGGLLGNLKAMLGTTLLLRAVTNREIADFISSAHHGIHVCKSITIRADVGEVFGFFSHYDNFPLFMRHVLKVDNFGDGRSRWTVAGPAGVPVTWEAVLTDYVPNRHIAWRTTGDATIGNEGYIRFTEPRPGCTHVEVRLTYRPPGGMLAHALACLLRADPKTELDADLARLKVLIEQGRIPHDAAQHPAATAPANQGEPLTAAASPP